MLLSDGWWIEGDKAWFVTTKFNELFEVTLQNNAVKYLATVPEISGYPWRQNPMCFKYKHYIFCLPDIGKCVWRYDLLSKDWSKEKIEAEDGIRIDIHFYYPWEDKCYLYSYALKSFLELDCEKNEIINSYKIANDAEEVLAQPALAGEYIYIPSNKNAVIYKFSLKSKVIEKIDVPELESDIRSICFDGENFHLTGNTTSVFKWNENTAKVKKIPFPQEFGVYEVLWGGETFFENSLNRYSHSTIYQIVKVGKYICLIPFSACPILFLNIEKDVITAFPLKAELETEKTVKRGNPDKFIFAYIKEDRYIGIYSYLNEWIFEIDIIDFSCSIQSYVFSVDTLEQIEGNYLHRSVIQYESEAYKLSDAIDVLCNYVYPEGTFESEFEKLYEGSTKRSAVGQSIYSCLKEDKIYE